MIFILKLNKSASRTIDILTLLSTSQKPLTQLEISQKLNLPKTSTYELIYTLLEKGIVQFDNVELKTFKLSLKIFEIGMAVVEKNDLTSVARPLLEEVGRQTGETVFLAVENSNSIIYLDRVEKSSSITTTVSLGKRRPMHCTGLGKALLATYSEEEVKTIWEATKPKEPLTRFTIMKLEDLLLELEATRKRGYAIDRREVEDEIYCVAVPIKDRTNKAIGAISIAALYFKMDKQRINQYARILMENAMSISRLMGYRNSSLYSPN